MVNGQPNWRCACFKELGWSDLRQVLRLWICAAMAGIWQGSQQLLTFAVDVCLWPQIYPGCEPGDHSCSTNPSLEDAASRASDEAAMRLINSL
jgi:hypothetical protein